MQDHKAKAGVVLVNLGSPATPEPLAVRQFLGRFLSDQRVVELPRWLWWPLLYGVILPLRSQRMSTLYRAIWTTEGSPLTAILHRQTQALQVLCPDVSVVSAVTYGEPSIRSAVEKLRSQGLETIVVLPLYPQYSGTTTGAVCDQLAAIACTSRHVPDTRLVRQYSSRPDYIAALAHSIRQHWASNERSEKLLFSFHGIPVRCVEKGDPYEQQCRGTAEAVAAALALSPEQWQVTFQSRFGKAEWLQPYTDVVLAELLQQGCRTVDVICPAFSADCLETLEEIEVGSRNVFLAAGGQRFSRIPCLNDAPEHIQMMAAIVQEVLAWPATAV